MKKLLLCSLIISGFSLYSGSKKNKETNKVPHVNLDNRYSVLRKARRNILVNFIVSNEPELFKTELSQGYRRRSFWRNTDELLSSLLILAYGLENDIIVAILLEYGAHIKNTDLTALHVASLEGSSDAIKVLLKKGVNIEATTNKELTALHLAVQEGHQKVVELLLEHNADVNATTDVGETPLTIAKEKGHTEIIKLLEEYKLSK